MEIDLFLNFQIFISQYIEFTQDELLMVLPFIKVVHLEKNEELISEGQIADIMAFTNKGYLRVYYNIDGEEITRDITPLNSFATALPSFIKQTPSYEIISAITPCELFTISRQDLNYLYNTYPKWERVGRRIIEDMFVGVQQRLYQFITEPAETRYKELVARYPDMIHDVPLKYIADFLGIKVQSLSRLRKSIKW